MFGYSLNLCFVRVCIYLVTFLFLFLAMQGYVQSKFIMDLAFSSHAMQCGCVQLESLSALGTELTGA